MSSDTPETDAKVSAHIGFYSCATVPAELCRRMERERDEAREERENSRQSLAFALEELNEARAVADELSSIAARYLGWHLSRTPMGPDDDHLAQARRITETLARWKALANA